MMAAEARRGRSQSSGVHAPTGPRYSPPRNAEAVPFSDLLAHCNRGRLEPKQLDFLAAVTKARDGDDVGKVFIAGDTSLLDRRCISVIGARKASPLGRQRARKFARELADRQVVVVSGLADGIDTEALTSAMDSGGRVVAVIGTPLDQAYPAKNKLLQEAIYRHHLLVSQFEQGERVFPSNFPARNRTMAALSDASVVIEASDSSGTLHQALECQKLGRWLGIARGVVEDPALTWPKKFLSYERCVVLESTDQFIAKIYG